MVSAQSRQRAIAIALAALTVLIAGALRAAAVDPRFDRPPPLLSVLPAAAVPVQHEPVALLIGDSYATGIGTRHPDGSFSAQAMQQLGWQLCQDAQPGTGFVDDGRSDGPNYEPYAARLADDVKSCQPDIVVVTGGRNDSDEPVDVVRTAATDYLKKVRTAFPNAWLVVVAPFWSDSAPPPSLLALRDTEQTLSARLEGTFIDPLGEQWITDENGGFMLTLDLTHPNQFGHDYLALRLVADIRGRLQTQPLIRP